MANYEEQLKKLMERESAIKESARAEQKKVKEQKAKILRAKRKAEAKAAIAEEKRKSAAVFKAVRDFYKKGAWGDLEKFKATVGELFRK